MIIYFHCQMFQMLNTSKNNGIIIHFKNKNSQNVNNFKNVLKFPQKISQIKCKKLFISCEKDDWIFLFGLINYNNFFNICEVKIMIKRYY